MILLLVSSDFLASDYCYGIEMKRALERHQSNEARVIPILLRPVDWKAAPFKHLQVLPTNAEPITIWSNQDDAFTDVAAGIRRAIEDLSLLETSAPRAALPSVWNIPFPRNSFFIGREALFSRLRTQLQAGQVNALSQPQAISGLGGIGKTQLAVEYAYRYHQDYQVVLWARAESREALISSYVTIASLLRLPEKDAQDQAITVQAVKTWLQTHRQWLLILDNADELALVPEFLPPALGGHLLLTTRAAALGRLASRIDVETLPAEQGALFLLRRASLIAPDALLEQASDSDQALALQITQELGGLPLALDQAGAYLEEAGSDLSDYQQIYQQYHAHLLKERGGLVADHPEPVATTWSLSFARVEERNPAAADLLGLCAFLSPDAIAEEIIMQGAPHLGPLLEPVAGNAFLLGQAIEALRAYSLMGRDPKRKTVSMHRLVQAVLRDGMDELTKSCWIERAIRAVHAALPPVEPRNWPLWERLVVHVQACVQHMEHDSIHLPEAAELLLQTGRYLIDCARYSEAQALLERAYAISEREQGAEHPETATILDNMAILYQAQGKYAEAESLFQRALAIYEQHLGAENPYTAASLNFLGLLYTRLGRYAEAEPLCQRALAIYEQHLGAEHPETATILNNLANVYTGQGKYAEAEPLYQRALAIDEQHLGAENLITATVLDNLAYLYTMLGRYAEAEPLFQRTLAIYEQHLGAEHPSTANRLDRLANLHQSQGRYGEAEPLFQRALAIHEKRLGAENPSTVISLLHLAGLYVLWDRYAEAKLLCQRVLAICEQHWGTEYPDMTYSLDNLARLYQGMGKHTEAESLFQRALVTGEQQLGQKHWDTHTVREAYASFLRKMGRDAEATVLETHQE